VDATADDTARASVYGLLGRLLSRPPAQEVLDLLRRIPSPGSDAAGEMAAAWETLRLASERAEVEALDDEYHDLFIGIAHGELIPYASWYMTGFLMDQPLVLLRRDLKHLGFERAGNVKEPEDHAAALLETMAYIIQARDEISFEEQGRFFHEHIAPWMEIFFRDMQKADSARFYCAVGQFGERFIRLEKQYLSLPA